LLPRPPAPPSNDEQWITTMKSPEEIDRLRTKMIEYLEAALALTDETGDGVPVLSS